MNDSQHDLHHFIVNVNIPKLSDVERDEIEAHLTYDECEKALRSFDKGKAPGEDGFTVEFYHFFLT